MRQSDIMLYIGLAGLGIGLYMLWLKLATDKAYEGGKWFAENVINPVKLIWSTSAPNVSLTASRGYVESGGKTTLRTNIPVTPSGYNPSNWTWDIPGGIRLGLPNSMTPKEFCAVSPDSPICSQLNYLRNGAGGR